MILAMGLGFKFTRVHVHVAIELRSIFLGGMQTGLLT